MSEKPIYICLRFINTTKEMSALSVALVGDMQQNKIDLSDREFQGKQGAHDIPISFAARPWGSLPKSGMTTLKVFSVPSAGDELMA